MPMHERQHSTSVLGEVILNPCDAPPPVPVVTTPAPVRAHQSLYVATPDCLYALNAADGTARWCQQVKLIRPTPSVPPPRGNSMPPQPRVTFGTPRVVNGVVYVSAHHYDGYAYAFTASDGSLRWRTPTDARVVSGPYLDFAVPQVNESIVYSGTYALDTQDGAVRWRIPIDTHEEGTVALPALSDETLYATTHRGIYAINAQDGQIRWLYSPNDHTRLSGPPVVAGRLLYAGTSGYIGHEEQSYFCALSVETGAEVWRYADLRGAYIGAAVHNETIYVSAGDRSLHALDKNNGVLRWQCRFAATGYYPATVVQNVLHITMTAAGAYALTSEDGTVLWHRPLASNPGVSFGPPVVLDGTLYLVRLDEHSRGVLYALGTRDGTEYWHTSYPTALSIALAQ